MNRTVSCGTTPMAARRLTASRHLNVLAVDAHAAGNHVVEAKQDATRSVPAPLQAHDRHRVARRRVEADIGIDRVGSRVEVDVVEHDLAADLERRRAATIGDQIGTSGRPNIFSMLTSALRISR